MYQSVKRALTLATCIAMATLQGPATAFSQEKDKVVLTHSTVNFAFLPILVAEAMGYFEEVGLDAEILKTGSGSKAMAAAVSGDANVMLGSPVSVLQARAKNSQLVLFSALIAQVNSNLVVSKNWAEKHNITESSTIEERLAALKGITIGVTGVGSGSDQIVRYLAKLGGLNPDRDLNIVGLGSDAGTFIAAIRANRVDGASISAPTSQIIISDLGGTMLFNNSGGAVKNLDGYFYIGAAANKDWLDKNPRAAGKVALAFQMTLNALADPQENLVARDKVHAQFFPAIDKAVFDAVWPNEIKSAPKSGTITREMMEFIVSLAQPFTGAQIDPALIEGSYTNSFAEEALKATKQ